MAGIGILLDLWRKHPSLNSANTLQSAGFFSASGAAASAAATLAAGTPLASRFLFGQPRVAYCDAGVATPGDSFSNKLKSSKAHFRYEAAKYATKEYIIQLKPLYSAFEPRNFAITSLRSFLQFYLPLLEPKLNLEDDEDVSQQEPQEKHVDLVVPFKKSVKQILRETTVVTTRRILERLAFCYISQRMAWKLLKDAPQSAVRKAQRGMPTSVYIFRVSRTTLRGHFLGVAAAWLVQFGMEIYRCLSQVINCKEGTNKAEKLEKAKLFGKKVSGITIRCGSSLLFASIGAGIGACVVRPSIGQWIGCAVGDFTGPIVVSVFLEKGLHLEL